ncbi:MAG: type II toxin-antitoxin system HicB family antitoxin [Phycisphaerales bacterium]
MKAVYPIVISKCDSDYVVYIPDFDINTEGKDVADAIAMARDAIGITGCYLEDEEKQLPAPSALEKVARTKNDDIITLVDIDFAEYRRKNDQRTVRKNLTLPSWLNVEAEKQGINFSKVLQEALLDRLQQR